MRALVDHDDGTRTTRQLAALVYQVEEPTEPQLRAVRRARQRRRELTPAVKLKFERRAVGNVVKLRATVEQLNREARAVMIDMKAGLVYESTAIHLSNRIYAALQKIDPNIGADDNPYWPDGVEYVGVWEDA
jgi:hypothetical protein